MGQTGDHQRPHASTARRAVREVEIMIAGEVPTEFRPQRVADGRSTTRDLTVDVVPVIEDGQVGSVLIGISKYPAQEPGAETKLFEIPIRLRDVQRNTARDQAEIAADLAAGLQPVIDYLRTDAATEDPSPA